MIKYSKFTDCIGSGNFTDTFCQNTNNLQKKGCTPPSLHTHTHPRLASSWLKAQGRWCHHPKNEVFIKDFFSEYDQSSVSCGLFTFTKEILNGKLHFFCSVFYDFYRIFKNTSGLLTPILLSLNSILWTGRQPLKVH